MIVLVKVNQVCVDHAGEFYASCSDDGRQERTVAASNEWMVDWLSSSYYFNSSDLLV
jgi:hypothetical protein